MDRGAFVRRNLEGKVLDVGSKDLFPYSGKKPDMCLDIEEKQYDEDIPFVRGDAHDLPFGDGSFDTVVQADVLEHVKNPRKCIEEALRVGKKLVATVPNEEDHKSEYPVYQIPDIPTLEKWLKGFGHRIKEMESPNWRGWEVIAWSLS